jgi:signal peptidase II
MKNKWLKWILFFAPIAVIVAIDQLTKLWAVKSLMGRSAITIIPGALELTYVENTGMAFGLLQDSTIFFYIMTAVALAVIVYFVIRIPFEKKFLPLFILLSFIAGGAVGNLIDRVFRKYVVDFIYISLIKFPVFNVADIFVSLSCITLVIFLLFVYKDEDLKRIRVFGKRKKENKESE